MKQKIKFPFFTLSLITLCYSVESFATSTLSLDCPNRYVAEVTSIQDAPANSLFSKIAVDFKIIETQKGEKLTHKKIEIIKDGPDKFIVGQNYLLQTNKEWLCAIETY